MPEILTESRASIKKQKQHDNIAHHHIRSRNNLRGYRNGNTAKARSEAHHCIKFKLVIMYDLYTLQDIQAAEAWHEREQYLLGMAREGIYSEPVTELEPESNESF